LADPFLTAIEGLDTVPGMLKLDISRRFLAILVALALFLGSASQAIAATAMMPCMMSTAGDDSMPMSSSADDGMSQGDHGMPCPASGTDCVWTAGCMAAPAIPLAEVRTTGIAHSGDRFEISSVCGSSRSIRPALPPPIILS